MTLALTATGLTIQNFTEALEEIVANLGTALSLTPVQVQRLRTNARSTLGNLSRIEAERDVAFQEALLAAYDALSWSAEGVQLENVVALLGVERTPALASQVTAGLSGVPGSLVPAGTRVRYNPEETTWITSEAVVLAGVTPVAVTLVSETVGEAQIVALDPDTGFDDWTLLDVVAGLTGIESTAQPVVGAPTETDTALRARARIEAYRRAQGPLTAIEAAIAGITGVTYVRAWDNTGPFGAVDSDGIPGRAINAVVEGGSTNEIFAALLAQRPAGIEIYGTGETANLSLGLGRYIAAGFDRVADITIWINCTITTSTSEEEAPADVTTVAAARLLEQGPILFGIGDDVLPYRLASSLSDIAGIDSANVTISTDDGATDPYSTAKRVISIRQRPTFAAVRITVTEA